MDFIQTTVGWMFLSVVGATVLSVLASLLVPLVPTGTSSGGPRVRRRIVLLNFIPWVYSIKGRRSTDVSWKSLRYIYFTVYALWVIGSWMLVSFEAAFFGSWSLPLLIELLRGNEFSYIYTDGHEEFWLPLFIFLVSLVLGVISTFTWFRTGRRLCSVRNVHSSLPFDVEQWPSEFVSPITGFFLWAWIVICWTGFIFAAMVYYSLANIGG